MENSGDIAMGVEVTVTVHPKYYKIQEKMVYRIFELKRWFIWMQKNTRCDGVFFFWTMTTIFNTSFFSQGPESKIYLFLRFQ